MLIGTARGDMGLFVCAKYQVNIGGTSTMQNILVGFMAVIAIGAGILGWWMENGGSKKNDPEEEDPQKNETEKEV